MSDDRELVQAVLAGRPGAFERLVREHQTLCWHIVLKLVRDPEEARDLCQDTFLRVHRSLHQYRFDSALRTWIGRVAYSIALRRLERKRLALDCDTEGEDSAYARIESGEDVQAEVAQAQLAALLRAQMRTLSPIQSMLITLYHLDELTIPEIAAMTDLPSGTIKSHLARARARLRERLAPHLGEPQ